MIKLIISTPNANIMVTVENNLFPQKSIPLEKIAHFRSTARNTQGEPGHLVMPESKDAFKDH